MPQVQMDDLWGSRRFAISYWFEPRETSDPKGELYANFEFDVSFVEFLFFMLLSCLFFFVFAWQGSCVGLYFVNRPEWLVVDHACSAYSLVSVPLYDTLGPEAVRYIVNHAAVRAIFCDSKTLNVVSTIFGLQSTLIWLKIITNLPNRLSNVWLFHWTAAAGVYVRDPIGTFDCGTIFVVKQFQPF